MTAPGIEEGHYMIRGGVQGMERLRVLARVMRPTTLISFARAGLHAGMTCLDVGCGSGSVALDMARLVGPGGRVVGIDIDEVKVNLARSDAAAERIHNVEFRLANIAEIEPEAEFDFVYARFLLTHLRNPAKALAKIRQAMRSGSTLVVADIDFRGHFTYPESTAVSRYVELYTEAAKRRGGDANIGPRLPALLAEGGFENVQMNVVQPAGTEGEVKLMGALTMENIADVVLAEELATSAEINQIVAALYDFARAPGTVGSMPRVVEAWGRRP